jgi:hypothetical protein
MFIFGIPVFGEERDYPRSRFAVLSLTLYRYLSDIWRDWFATVVITP